MDKSFDAAVGDRTLGLLLASSASSVISSGKAQGAWVQTVTAYQPRQIRELFL